MADAVNLYASLGRLKARLGRTGSNDDSTLMEILGETAREIDGRTRRHFYAYSGKRYYQGHPRSPVRLLLPHDLVSVSSLLVDKDGDGTYELTLTVNEDYWLGPFDAAEQGWPYSYIELNPNGTQLGSWPCHPRAVEITGVFGYSYETEASGTLGAAISSTTATSVTMTAGHGLTGGETIIIDSEQLFVSAVASNALTVVRGVNGTTAATHGNGAAVTRRRYPAVVEGACLLRAADNWRGLQTGYGQVAAEDVGGFASRSAFGQFAGQLELLERRGVG